MSPEQQAARKAAVDELKAHVGRKVRSASTGERGTVIQAAGGLRVEMEGTGSQWPYYQHEWIPIDKQATRVAPQSVARVRYEVDRLLLGALGKSLPQWEDLRDNQRVAWNRAVPNHVNEGPREFDRSLVTAAIERVFGNG